MKLSLGISPCPNDTFIFDALVNNGIDTGGLSFEVFTEDVETLNRWAIAGKLDISKVSYGVFPLLQDHYSLLRSGGALGRGVGPLLIAKPVQNNTPVFDPATMSVAIPGEHTTAHLLFSLAYPTARHKRFMIFSAIEEAVLSGEVDAGVIIHENRFTYAQRGLEKLLDLGAYWEEKTGGPIPLGGIVMKNTFDVSLRRHVEMLIRDSLARAFQQYPELSSYVRAHAQTMEEAVMRQHIDLYVNDYSLDLGPDGEAAVKRLMEVDRES